VRQGDKNVSALAARVADDSENLAVRMTACRVLMKLGAPGRPAVTAATDSPKKELRVKAIECLGRIDPVEKASVDKLISLLDDKDNDIRRAALLGLTSTGKDGSKATNKLTAMLNDLNEDEKIRDLVKGTLKAVDPRKGLMGADKARE
jgi:HEAT repeat protein